ncbi:MAG: hypothetical protein RBR87_11500 [Bacteroidales bacterium]|jgi:hypothetical protein|nr:hypothetical protein [Bacteroidales bacterium]
MKQHYLLIFSLLMVVTATFFIPAKATAGWLIIEQQDDGLGNFGSQAVFIQGQLLRIENEKSVFIVNLESEQITLIFPGHQLFWTGHPDSLRKAISDRLEQQIDVLLAQMPPGMREENDSNYSAQLARFRSGEFVPDTSFQFEVIRLPETDSVLHYPTSMVEFYADSILLERIWTTQAVNPYAEIDKQKLARLFSLFNPPSRVSAHRSYKAYQSITSSGFVLKSLISTPYGSSITEVTTLVNREIPLCLFEPTEDYRPAMLERILEITMGEDRKESGNPFIKPADNSSKSPVPELPQRPQ